MRESHEARSLSQTLSAGTGARKPIASPSRYCSSRYRSAWKAPKVAKAVFGSSSTASRGCTAALAQAENPALTRSRAAPIAGRECARERASSRARVAAGMRTARPAEQSRQAWADARR
eukprot:scaffold5650_cov129-Isochrysis_galbana.AAC.1